jgi:hypothetical protein
MLGYKSKGERLQIEQLYSIILTRKSYVNCLVLSIDLRSTLRIGGGFGEE